MASAKGLLLDTLGRFALREAKVTEVRPISDRVRSITLAGPRLRDLEWTPGDKIQLMLPSRDVRTYTPIRWDRDRGATELLVFEHGTSPGAAWSRAVAVGDDCRFVGPQRSIRRSPGRFAVVFGDETSFGVAAALHGAGPDAFAAVLEVASRGDAERVVAATLATATVTVVERTPGDAHLADVAGVLRTHLAAHADAELLLTGRAQSIQRLRPMLGRIARDRSKPYWSVGKAGLD